MTFAPSDHTFAVCAYKENPYLASTVESLLAQDARCPIIISTSTPNDHISAVARRFEVPVVVNPDPRGAASDWNYGYDAAETPLVTIAHQDDYYEPNYLSTMLAAVNDYEEGGLQLAFSDYFEIRNGERVARQCASAHQARAERALGDAGFERVAIREAPCAFFGQPHLLSRGDAREGESGAVCVR